MENTVTPMEMCVGSQVIAVTPTPFIGPRATTACQARAATMSQWSNLMAGCQRAIGLCMVIGTGKLPAAGSGVGV